MDVPADEIAEALIDELPDFTAEEIAELVGEPTLATLVHDILSWRVAAFVGAGECEFEVKIDDDEFY